MEAKGVKTDNLLQHSFNKGSKMTDRPDSSTSTVIKRVWQGLLILVFIISIWGIGALSTFYVRGASPTVYAFSAGAGELWLTLVALSALEAFFIVSFKD